MNEITIAIIGRPSSGKSSFVNTITENNVSIVSSVPQSTLTTIKGIYENNGRRFVFFDTPGLYEGKTNFNKLLRKQSLNAIRDCDAILYLIDGKDKAGAEEERVSFYAKTSGKPCVVLINKSDIMTEDDERRAREFLSVHFPECDQIFVGSAKLDKGLDEPLRALAKAMEGAGSANDAENGESARGASDADESREDWAADEDGYAFTDSPLDLRVAEAIRESAFHWLMEELPHSVCVICDSILCPDNGATVRICATVYCEKESQKGMVIGKEGRMIKKIKNGSISKLKAIFPGKFVEVELSVKVKKDWKRDRSILAKLGLPAGFR